MENKKQLKKQEKITDVRCFHPKRLVHETDQHNFLQCVVGHGPSNNRSYPVLMVEKK